MRMATTINRHKIVIGRAEYMHFVDVGANDIPAKVDTGAYRSAVHASDIKLSNDGKTLSFKLLGNHPICSNLSKEIITKDFSQVKIANSFGDEELRYEVKMRVKLGPKTFAANFSLADRSKKIYPILIGRKILNGRFMVDTSQTSLNRIELKKKYGIAFPEDEEK